MVAKAKARTKRFPRRPAALFRTANHPLAQGFAPSWASGWGEDRFGVWLELSLGEARQRLRWIGPNDFLMGPEPEDSPVWVGDNDPDLLFDISDRRRIVSVPQGFWLFDTPVTQALWEAALGMNPSAFVRPDRPVEQVSWFDVMAFLELMNNRFKGLDLTIPTETQWEYAARAGTTTPTYAGPLDIRGENNAPVLDPIAWYGGNSGVGYDLEEGVNSTGWPAKQHPHVKAGTRSVAQKAPNAFGLYDMLGNVWEWCDGAAPPDPQAASSGQKAVEAPVRGGSWNTVAEMVHAASRQTEPADSSNYRIGFRCIARA